MKLRNKLILFQSFKVAAEGFEGGVAELLPCPSNTKGGSSDRVIMPNRIPKVDVGELFIC